MMINHGFIRINHVLTMDNEPGLIMSSSRLIMYCQWMIHHGFIKIDDILTMDDEPGLLMDSSGLIMY